MTTHTLSLGPLSLLASQSGPLLTITIHAPPSDIAPVGRMTLTVAEWTSLVALVDCMGAADKRHAEDRAEIERLNNLRDIDYIASKQLRDEALAENDSLRQQVRELTEERDRLRRNNEIAQEVEVKRVRLIERLNDAVFEWRNWGDRIAPPFGSDRDRSDSGQRAFIEQQLSQARSDLSAALVSVDAMAERLRVIDHASAQLRMHLARALARWVPDRPGDQAVWDACNDLLAHTAREQAKEKDNE